MAITQLTSYRCLCEMFVKQGVEIIILLLCVGFSETVVDIFESIRGKDVFVIQTGCG